MSQPLIPPFAVTASYQKQQFGSGSIYTPGVPGVFSALQSPPSSGTAAESASDTSGEALGFEAYSAANAVQVITITGAPAGGTFLLYWGDSVTSALGYQATAAQVQTALNALASVPAPTGGTNDRQTVTISGSPAGGTFTLTFGGQTTAGIAFNAAASAVQTAVQALSSVGAGNATVTGSNGGPWVITFTGTLANAAQSVITANGASLTGGTSPSVAVVHTTTGVAKVPSIVVTGSTGGPYTVTFQNLLTHIPVALISANGTGLTGGTNPTVTVVQSTAGTPAFVNNPLADTTRHRDSMYDFYDHASGMHF